MRAPFLSGLLHTENVFYVRTGTYNAFYNLTSCRDPFETTEEFIPQFLTKISKLL
jgi:hypothetical protein